MELMRVCRGGPLFTQVGLVSSSTDQATMGDVSPCFPASQNSEERGQNGKVPERG